MGKYINIMAKVSPATADRLERVRLASGFRSKYEVVQAAVALMLRWADPGTEDMSPDEEEKVESMRELFGSVESMRELVASVKPNGGRKVSPSLLVAFYGKECLMLKTLDVDGNTETSTNVRNVIEAVLLKTLPTNILSKLREVQKKNRYPSLLHVITELAKNADAFNEVGEEVDELFHDYSEADPRMVKLGKENKPARAKSIKKYL
ncbi:MAG: hypothetical protein J6U69_03645 [Alistipes sp.]|nr:hypothetical protein [Alistipes sp.]